jgi:outer membrane protein TolC
MNRHALRCGAGLLACVLLPSPANAQPQSSTIEKPHAMPPVRSYLAPTIPPVRLTNSARIYTLIRAGNLYLTLQDALALAIENNLNLEIDRYGPLLMRSALERAKAGGPLRGVPSASAQASSVDSGLGVNGSTVSAGLSGSGGGGSGGGGVNTTIQQIGVVAPNFDPNLQSTATFSHLSQPQANTILSQTDELIQSVHTYNTVVQQGLLTGGLVQYRDYEQYLNENSPSDVLNPAVGPHMDLTYRQPLLQGFGLRLNDRGIRIAAVNAVASREAFRSQLLDLVVSVTNLYWDFAAAREELRLRQNALEITQKFVDDTKYEISVEALAGVELPRAEAELAARCQDLAIAQAAVSQRAVQLKEALSHTEDPALEAAEIVPVDPLEAPAEEDLPPLRQLLADALQRRPDVALANYKDQTSQMNLAGTTNPLLPTLTVQLQTYDRGAAGAPQASGGQANQYFAGGYGTALKQIFGRDFPNENAQAGFSIPIGNRSAQADYGIDQLQFRQGQLQSQRDQNQILVDISSAVAALRQAHARHNAARDTRQLQEELLAGERQKSGAAAFHAIMADQRALIAARLAEMTAVSALVRARVARDQVLGQTLEKSRISLEEALTGRVARESLLP